MKFTTLTVIALLLCTVLLLFSACTFHGYDDDWMIGKTSAEIEARYGTFDKLGMNYEEDGLLRKTCAGYIIRESRTSWFGRTTEQLLVVYFDELGIACQCAVEPGNWGG